MPTIWAAIRSVPLNYCPDEEGIKTAAASVASTAIFALNYCPDEEGIKTDRIVHLILSIDFELLP